MANIVHYISACLSLVPMIILALLIQRRWLGYRYARQSIPLSPMSSSRSRSVNIAAMMPNPLGLAEGQSVFNETSYRSLIDRVSAVIYVADWSGKIGFVSPSVLSLTGYTAQELNGRTYGFLVDPEMLPEVAEHYIKQRESGLEETTLEFRIITRTGQKKWVEQTALLLTKNGKKEGFQCLVRDITEKKTMQDEHHRQLTAAKNEADDARKMQEQFLANMSHEIRTPMNGIQGMTNLLLETELNPQQKEFADVISRSVGSLLVIINDILDFSKIKAGKMTLEKIDFRLVDILTNVHSLFEPRVRKKGLLFTIDHDENIPEWLTGDPHRLNQVLINLVGNAVKFTEKGAVNVYIGVKQRLTGELTLEFKVRDSGVGIPEKSLPTLFNSFSQARLDISRKYGGTGLGLAICHQLVTLQKGDITVFSREGEGTSFIFTLPFEIAQQKAGESTAITKISDYGPFLRDKQFLVVEDNPVNQKLVEYVLQKVGAAVTIANHGREAVEILQHTPFDLIIMDLQMPEMDGYETTRYLRTQLKLQTPVMAMTANAIQGEQLRCLEAGMNDYMSKPFDFHEFYAHVTELLPKDTMPVPAVAPTAQSTGYSLSLLEEVGDQEYLRDIVQTLVTAVPGQLCELKKSMTEGDYEKIFLTAHKLTSSCGIIRAVSLTEKLSAICRLAKERADCSLLVNDVIRSFNKLLSQLRTEIEGVQPVNDCRMPGLPSPRH